MTGRLFVHRSRLVALAPTRVHLEPSDANRAVLDDGGFNPTRVHLEPALSKIAHAVNNWLQPHEGASGTMAA